MQKLAIGHNQRHIVTADGKPFFWLADTAWDLFRQLDLEQADFYFATRAAQGFNVIQAVLISEFESLAPDSGNVHGQPSLHDWNPATPNQAYFEHVDQMLELAAKYQLYIALLPTWGDKVGPLLHGTGPLVFTVDNAAEYARFLAKRYAEYNQIIWMIGGDRTPRSKQQFEIWRTIALTLNQYGANQLKTFHPQGETSSSWYMHSENWLDLNAVQSGHAVRNNPLEQQLIDVDYARQPIKPVLNAEPCYEAIPVNLQYANGLFTALDIRQAAYTAVFHGACGHTYGHYSIFMFHSWQRPGAWADPQMLEWQQALLSEGASQMQHLKNLLTECDFTTLSPVFVTQAGVFAVGNTKMTLFYLPTHLTNLDFNLDAQNAFWFDPRDGSRQLAEQPYIKPLEWQDAVLVVSYS